MNFLLCDYVKSKMSLHQIFDKCQNGIMLMTAFYCHTNALRKVILYFYQYD